MAKNDNQNSKYYTDLGDFITDMAPNLLNPKAPRLALSMQKSQTKERRYKITGLVC